VRVDPQRASGDDAGIVAILSRSWGATHEAGWALRQVAGALACVADVHVLTPQGKRPRVRADGVFTVHELASAPDPMLEARRDILVDAIVGAPCDEAVSCAGAGHASEQTAGLGAPVPAHDRGDTTAEVVRALVDGELAKCWEPAGAVLREMGADLVVVGDYRQAGAVGVVDRACGGVPMLVVPLATDPRAAVFEAFARLFERSTAAVVFTESERHALGASYGKEIAHNVGLPMAANRSVLREPNVQLGETDYVVVLTGTHEDSPEPPASLGRFLRARLGRRNLALVTANSFVACVDGDHHRSTQPIERGSDMLRLMAWARATVDLRPGRLFARRCLESLLYSTPIVAPASTRAAEHAASGGGLWFEGPSDLAYCVEAMFDPALGDALGEEGSRYAERHYGSTDRFIEKVLSAAGLDEKVHS